MTLDDSKEDLGLVEGGRQPVPAGAIIHAEQRQRHPTHPGVHPAVPRNSKDVQGGEKEGNLHA